MYTTSSLPKKRRIISSSEPRRSSAAWTRATRLSVQRTLVTAALVTAVCVAGLSCGLRSEPSLISVYVPEIKVSILLPQGWRAEGTRQSGFYMHSFTGMSVDVPDRPGIRVQIMSGDMPDSRDMDDLAQRYIGDLQVSATGSYEFSGHSGMTWEFDSEQSEEAGRLMLTDVDGTLYGLYARGEARTLLAYDTILDEMWSSFSLEQPRYFERYEAPGGDAVVSHPRSWPRTATAAKPGESLFVGFRSAPLAVEEDGTTVHATFEVTVNVAASELTVERFYEQRTELLGDNYRLLSHETMQDGSIATLYKTETQLAEYLERTIYSVKDGKSMIYKVNARVQVYRAIEAWIDDIVTASIAANASAA